MMGLSGTVFEINGDFSRKSQNFPTPVYFAPHWARGFSLELALGVKKTRMMGLPDGKNSFKIDLAI